jgi:hypothetical protein
VGNFYTNITTVGPSQDELLPYLRELRRAAYVSPTIQEVTVIYDRECDKQRVEDLHQLSAALTERFDCKAAAALVHDDDVLFFAAYDRGELVTEYESSAGREIRPLKLCRLFGVSTWRVPRVWLALVRPHLLYLFEAFRHRRLIRLLNLSHLAVGVGYNYIEGGELPAFQDGQEPELRHTRDVGSEA